jgi:TPP-dependent pyruvate/acetoin dehydrogenase alpha subunit
MAKILDTQSSRGAETAIVSSPPPLIPPEKLLAIYASMVKCRMLQQKAAGLFQQGRLDADLHASLGREACAAAVGVDLQAEDILSIAPGDWLPAFAKGLPAEIIFRALAPRIDGHSSSGSEEAKKHNILESGTEQPAIVLDRAEGLRSAKRPAIVAAFFQSDGASRQQWQKVLSAAAEKKLPILFVQHALDGRLANASSARSQSKTPHALFRGVPVIGVDAADPVALYRVAYEAILRARQGRGATLLECAAIPILHTVDPGTNPPLPPPDSVAIMESYLKGKGISPEPSNRQGVAEFARDLDLATRFLAP